ncbi:MAG: UDP-N-acetylglucosamine 1-carboxyvinyltransferase [Clostridiales bacterium]|nr:UDP-N-acetylglucosamine 1-carboxyvinyltransferase [Clostridiales bacterium]
MDSILICGETPLYGRLRVQGSKNAALPILAATVLVPGISVLHNCPKIEDVRLMCKLLETVGCQVKWENHTVTVDASGVVCGTLPSEYVEKMRSSVIFMGAMLGRVGEVSLKYPGGCVIGKRPIDLHLKAMEQFGVQTRQTEEGIVANAGKMKGAHIIFPISSVGATENTILAAVYAEGTTVLEQAAREPEIQALCAFLRRAGAEIAGDGSGRIRIDGQRTLHGCEYTIPPDRIVTGTYLLGCMAAGGEICLENAPAEELSAVFHVLKRMGAELFICSGEVHCRRTHALKSAGNIMTEVYPGYPTDLQSPMLAVMALAEKNSSMTETIFENRFRIVEELNRMGAGIHIQGKTAFVPGARRLHGARVTAQELRGGAALVIAGLAAEGITAISGRQYIDRGYENIAKDFETLGAKVLYEENSGKDSRQPVTAAAGKENR